MTITAFPLAWPAGWRRIESQYRKSAKFGKGERRYSADYKSSWTRKRELTIADGVERVRAELRSLGVPDGESIISTNLELRLDGLPRSNQPAPADPGVAVYWQIPTEPMRCMATDRYDRVADNLAAIAATLEAMRAIERHGGAEILDRAFTGFAALPPPGGTSARGWREVLGVDATERDIEKVKERYRRLSAVHHPDRGGSSDMMAEINWAWSQAQESLT